MSFGRPNLLSANRALPISGGLRLDGDDLRRLPLSERKAKLRKLLSRAGAGIQYVWHVEADGAESFEAALPI